MAFFEKQVEALLRTAESQIRSDPSGRILQRLANLTTEAAMRTGAIATTEPPIIFRGELEAPEKMFASLMTKADMLLKKLIKRMLKPNDPRGLLSRKAAGPAAMACIHRVLAEVRRAIYHSMQYAEETRIELPEKLKDTILEFEFELINPENPAPMLASTPINYAEYGVQRTEDHAVNFLISMAEVMKLIATVPECMEAPRISRFRLNTTSKHGRGGLGTATFVEDVKFFFKYTLENSELLARSRALARLNVADNIRERSRLHDLQNRLRGLHGLAPASEPANLRALRAAHERLGGGAAGAGGGRQGGGGRKTRKARKTRKTNKSRKNRRHH